MSDPANPIAIVTAFFDIGRSGWTADKNLPAYLYRTVDHYFERFAHLATLDNEMAIYTLPDLADRVQSLRTGKEDRTKIIPIPYAELFPARRMTIRRILADPSFQSRINPAEVRNPEYWSEDYVLVTSLKPMFVNHAVTYNHVTAPVVAWMDFGYCRSIETLANSTIWNYPFDPGKIHIFGSSPNYRDVPVRQVVENNLCFIAGAGVVTGRALWPKLAGLNEAAFQDLVNNNMVDDDQTLMLMASLAAPELFDFHRTPKNDWAPLLWQYNTSCPAYDPALSD